jgi:hypothetical protein
MAGSTAGQYAVGVAAEGGLSSCLQVVACVRECESAAVSRSDCGSAWGMSAVCCPAVVHSCLAVLLADKQLTVLLVMLSSQCVLWLCSACHAE